MKELLNENSKSYKLLNNSLAALGLVFAALVLLSIYNVLDLFYIGLWGWMVTFGAFLLQKGFGDIFYRKRKDGVIYIFIPVVLLIIVIWLTLVRG